MLNLRVFLVGKPHLRIVQIAIFGFYYAFSMRYETFSTVNAAKAVYGFAF